MCIFRFLFYFVHLFIYVGSMVILSLYLCFAVGSRCLNAVVAMQGDVMEIN